METRLSASPNANPVEARKINLVRFILDLQDEKTLSFLEHLFFNNAPEAESESEILMLRERLAEFRANPEEFYTLAELIEEFGSPK